MAAAPREHRRRLLRLALFGLLLLACLCAIPPATRKFCVWRGEAALAARNDSRAVTWLGRAGWLDAGNAQVHYLLARAYRRTRQFDKVQFQLQEAHRLGAGVKQLEREQWLTLAATGQFDPLRDHWAELFTDVGDDGPEIGNAYVLWCLSRFRLKDALRALAAWQQDFPTDPQPHYLHGLLHEALLNWDHAIREHKTALDLNPLRNDVRFHLAECHMHRLQVREAEETYRRCVERDPAHRDAAVGWAKALLKLGQAEQARQVLTRQLEVNSPSADILHTLGDLELMANRPAEAQKHLESACRQQPENPAIHYALGRALQALGNKEAAREHFAFVTASQKPLDQLSVKIERLVNRPDDVELRYDVAMTTWKYRSRPDGAKWFHSLLDYDPHHAKTHAALAEHYALLGDQTRAEHHRRLAQNE